ncbi:MAG: HNH endonuclease [Phyllobacterium sp.]|nr:HNH endonuclease [Phyllobacterium sp.]
MIKKVGKAALKGKEVDHTVPLAAGGSNKPGNLGILTIAANRRKQPKRK